MNCSIAVNLPFLQSPQFPHCVFLVIRRNITPPLFLNARSIIRPGRLDPYLPPLRCDTVESTMDSRILVRSIRFCSSFSCNSRTLTGWGEREKIRTVLLCSCVPVCFARVCSFTQIRDKIKTQLFLLISVAFDFRLVWYIHPSVHHTHLLPPLSCCSPQTIPTQ